MGKFIKLHLKIRYLHIIYVNVYLCIFHWKEGREGGRKLVFGH